MIEIISNPSFFLNTQSRQTHDFSPQTFQNTNPPLNGEFSKNLEKKTDVIESQETLTNNNQHKHSRNEKKLWRPNRLPSKWKKLTSRPTWKELSNLEKQILKLGWPNRHLKLSYNEIATLLNIHRNAAIRLMQKLKEMEFIKKEKSFIKKKNGKFTSIHKRNYYVFTEVGRAGIEILLNKLFLHSENEPLKNLTKVRKNKPSEKFYSQEHFLDKKLSEVKKAFKKHSFENQISRAYEGTIQILLSHPLEKIKKILNLMRQKIQKGWKLKEFWGFFLKMLKNHQKPRSFFQHLANAYLEAAGGNENSVTDGVDSHIICESLKKLQATGEKITESKLARILHHGTQKVKTALEGICYRGYLGRGILPKDQSELEETKKPKRQPITKLVQINSQTGKLYSTEDRANGKNFCMKIVVVGYEELSPRERGEKFQNKSSSTKIRSWIGLLMETLKTCKDCESIQNRYFKTAPLLGG